MTGYELESETDFAEYKGSWMRKYNVVYVILIIAVLFMGKDRTPEDIILFGAFLCGGAFLVKQELVKWMKRRLDNCRFAVEHELTASEIGSKIAYVLLNEGIEAVWEENELIFKGKNVVYTFTQYDKGLPFSLVWGYPSLGKAFSPGRLQMITEYKEMLQEMAVIAYCIQHANEYE